MRRIPWLILPVLLLSLPCLAQQKPVPVFEISGAYSYVRYSSTKSNFNGGSVSFALNPNPWLGVVADVGAYHESVIQGFDSSNLISYLFGPRISYRSEDRITPYAQVLFGGAYDTLMDRSALAMTAGGGLDVSVAHHVALRLVQGEYFMTRFGRDTQNNVRISTGIVFQFGGR